MNGSPPSCLADMECADALMHVSLVVTLTARRRVGTCRSSASARSIPSRSNGARSGNPRSGGGEGVGVSAGLTPLSAGSAAGGNVYLEHSVSACTIVPRCVRDGRL